MDGLTRDGLRIWQAGVDAVRADRVLRDRVHWDGRFLAVRGETMDLQDAQRFIVIGAGKAGGGMLAGLADVLGAH